MGPKYMYRLKEYRICELANGRLWWEAHSEFGSQSSGPCFVWGDVLLMGARRNEEIGFLKSEFLDSLRKLPRWRKTSYYCSASTLLDVDNGQVVNEDLLAQIKPARGEQLKGAEKVFSGGPTYFRLGRYQTVVAPDANISWICSGWADRLINGTAIIESSILFLGPGTIGDEKKTKKDFSSMLLTLPDWDRTILWSRSLALKTVPQEDRPAPLLPALEKMTIPHRDIIFTRRHNWHFANQFSSQTVSFLRACSDEVREKWLQIDFPKLFSKLKMKLIGRNQ